MRTKFLVLMILTAGLFWACPPQGTLPEETADRNITNISVGQENGAVVLTWTDPKVTRFTDVGISYAKLSDRVKSSEKKVKKGIQSYSVANLEVGETYIFYLEPYAGSEKMLNEPQSVAHEVTPLSLKIKKAFFGDLYADFEWTITGDEPYKEVWVSVGNEKSVLPPESTSVTIELDPARKYAYSVRCVGEDGSIMAFASGNGTTLLFFDDFTGPDTVSIPRDYSGTDNDYISDAGDAPRRTAWENPIVSAAVGPNGNKVTNKSKETSFHGYSTWCHKMVPNWSMIDWKTDSDGTDYIRFKGEQPDTPSTAKASGVQSRNWFYFTYGRVEFRARLTKGSATALGHFPALWFMPQYNNGDKTAIPQWPDDGEIDLYEHSAKSPGCVWQTNYPRNGSVGWPFVYDIDGNTYTPHVGPYGGNPSDWEQWQVFAIEWTPSGLQYYINDIKTKYVPATDSSFVYGEDSAFYIIMNMGVSTGDCPNNTPGNTPNQNANFKAEFEIDYVKVFSNQHTIIHDCPYYAKEKERRAKMTK